MRAPGFLVRGYDGCLPGLDARKIVAALLTSLVTGEGDETAIQAFLAAQWGTPFQAGRESIRFGVGAVGDGALSNLAKPQTDGQLKYQSCVKNFQELGAWRQSSLSLILLFRTLNMRNNSGSQSGSSNPNPSLSALTQEENLGNDRHVRA